MAPPNSCRCSAFQRQQRQAVQFIAAGSLTVIETGRIHGGGAGGLHHAGVSSGGAILLEPPVITVAGVLAAKGGGSGTGSGPFGGENAAPSDQPAKGAPTKWAKRQVETALQAE